MTRLLLVAVLATLTGSGSGSNQTNSDRANRQSGGFAGGYDTYSNEDRPTQAEIDDIETAYEDVRLAFYELEYQVSRFSDGSTGWRYGVADIEFALDDFESLRSRGRTC